MKSKRLVGITAAVMFIALAGVVAWGAGWIGGSESRAEGAGTETDGALSGTASGGGCPMMGIGAADAACDSTSEKAEGCGSKKDCEKMDGGSKKSCGGCESSCGSIDN